MWGSRTSQARTPDRRYRRIRTCLPGEVESSSSPIRRLAPDVKYPEKVECQPDRIAAVRHPKKVGCRSDRIAAVRHPDKVERWPDRIPDMRYPGGMRENFLSGWNERCHVSQGTVCMSKGEGATLHFLGRIPQWVVVPAVQGGFGPLHNHQGKKLQGESFKRAPATLR